MIEVKIDPVKMIQGLRQEDQQPQQQAPPQEQQQPQGPIQAQGQGQGQPAPSPLDAIPPNPVVMTGIKSVEQVQSAWDRMFGFLQ